jgi:hypothetical protein
MPVLRRAGLRSGGDRRGQARMPLNNRTRRGFPALIALLGLGASIPCAVAADSEKQSLEELRDTVINLLQTLVQQGVLTQEKAQELVRKAQEKAAASLAARQQEDARKQLEEKDAIRVPYVPQIVKDEIAKEVAQEVRPQVSADVVSQAKSEGWGVPGALADWLRRVRVDGDITVRGQADLYDAQNSLGCPPEVPYGNCTILDFNAVNAAGGIGRVDPLSEFLNVRQDRYRLRIRARLGVDADITDTVHTGIRLATGALQDPTSESQNIGSGFGRYTVGFDQMYIRWEPHTAKGFKYFMAEGGRFGNPFFSPTEMVWGRDLSFDGFLFSQRVGLGDGSPDQSNVFVMAGGFPVQELPLVAHNDKWLLGGQVGGTVRFAQEHRITLAAAYYDFIRVEGVRNQYNTTFTNYTAPQFVRFGNSMCDVANSSDPSVNLFALCSRFRIADIAGAYVLPIGRYRFGVDAEAARNLGYNRNDILSRTGSDVSQRDRGYVGDLYFGTPTADREPGSWRVMFGYRYVQGDAVVDSLTDPDFHLGGTNAAGYFGWFEYGLARNFWTRLRYMSGREIDGANYRVDVIQLDFNTRF